MEHWEDEVIETIKEPNYGIFKDAKFEDRVVYYRFQNNKPRYMKVVVKTFDDRDDRVITAYLTDSGKRGEVFI